MKYLTESQVAKVFRTNDVIHQSATGYGSKLPMNYKIQLVGSARKYRMYCCVFSNATSCYIVKNGEKLLTSHVEHTSVFQNPIILANLKFA